MLTRAMNHQSENAQLVTMLISSFISEALLTEAASITAQKVPPATPVSINQSINHSESGEYQHYTEPRRSDNKIQ